MARYLSHDTNAYTIGRLSVYADPSSLTGLRWNSDAPFKRGCRVAGTGGPRYGYAVTVNGHLLCCRRLVWELQNGPAASWLQSLAYQSPGVG